MTVRENERREKREGHFELETSPRPKGALEEESVLCNNSSGTRDAMYE